MNLAELIITRFAGRADQIAVGGVNGDFAPEAGVMTAARIESEHLAARRCLGFYVMRVDNRVLCSCADFDNKPDNPDPKWREKAEQVYIVLSKCGLSPLVEISQSGNGAHVWLFFDEPTDAWLVRAWWRAIERLIKTEFREVFPKQDELTGKGFGNLVRYPLWNESSFVDVENDWSLIDPVEALRGIRPTNGTDLSMLAFQLGVGELKAEPKAAVVSIAQSAGVDGLLPLRVQKHLERQSSLLARRWAGESGGMKDGSRSAIAMSICVELVRLYTPTSEIASALRYWCEQNGIAEKGRRADWIDLTVTNAYDFVVSRQEKQSAAAVTFQQACHLYLDRIESGGALHTPSGIMELDESIEGVGMGEVAIIAARPSHGKSAFAFQWVDYASTMMMPCLVISEEMIASEIGKRRLQTVSEVPPEQWVKASIPHMRTEVDDYHAMRAPVYIVEGCSTIDRAEEVIDQFCSLHDVGMVAVDYLQLLGHRGGDRYEVVTEVSRRIKQATVRNGCRTLLLSQMNRQVEGRQDYEPKLSDLRESGQIEQDADLVLFLQWPHRFDPEAPKELYRITAAKRRNGAIHEPRIETTFDGARQIFGKKKSAMVKGSLPPIENLLRHVRPNVLDTMRSDMPTDPMVCPV